MSNKEKTKNANNEIMKREVHYATGIQFTLAYTWWISHYYGISTFRVPLYFDRMRSRVIVLLLTVINCTGNDSAHIRKTWIEKKWKFQSLAASDFLIETSMTSTLAGMTITFDDQKYSIHSRMGLQRGKWRLIDNDTKIEMTDFALRIDVFSIEKLDDGELHLKLGDNHFFIVIRFISA